jgi:hypothetical protein
MGTSDVIIEQIAEEFNCKYGDIHASPQEVKIIDIFYKWLEKNNLNPEGCIDNTGDRYFPSFELEVSSIEENSEESLQIKLTQSYEEEGYRASVAIQNSRIEVSLDLGDKADWIDPDDIEDWVDSDEVGG